MIRKKVKVTGRRSEGARKYFPGKTELGSEQSKKKSKKNAVLLESGKRLAESRTATSKEVTI
jgi:hypothetical protein